MQTQQPAAFTATPILTLKDLGFEGTVGLDQASRGLAERSEAQIVREFSASVHEVFSR